MLPSPATIGSAAAALTLVVMLIACAGWVARHFGAARRITGTRRLALRETLALDARRRLHLLECDGETILVLSGGASDVMLAAPRAASPR